MSYSDKDKLKKYNRDYYLKNKGKILLKNKTWTQDNREAHNSFTANYHKENPNYYQEHKERISETSKLLRRVKRETSPNYYIWEISRARAKRNKIEFNIEPDDIIVPKICPILGIPLYYSNKRTHNTPSLDRIDNSKGYIKGNISVISWKANRIKNNLSIEQIHNLYRYTLG